MAPRKKNISDLSQNVVKKRERKVKPVKPPLKTPTIIRFRIPKAGSKTNTIERTVTEDLKLKLANEVALAQLVKPRVSPKPEPSTATPTSAIAENSSNSPIGTLKPKTVRKRKPPQRKPAEDTSPSDTPLVNLVSNQSVNTSPNGPTSPKRNRIQSLKALLNDDFLKGLKKRKKVTTDSKEIKKKPGPKSKTMGIHLASATTKLESIVLEPTPVNPKPAIKNKPTTQAKNKRIVKDKCKHVPSEVSYKTEPVTRGKNTSRKGQQKVKPTDVLNEMAPEVTPKPPVKKVYKRKSLPKANETEKMDPQNSEVIVPAKKVRPRKILKTEQPKGKGKTSGAQSKKAAIVDRVLRTPTSSDSVKSSYSDLSWTRNISTESGSVTCVTVSSNEVVRFNNKVPIVQIPCLDSNVVRRKVTDLNVSGHSSSSSSSDSESTSDSSSESDMDISQPEPKLSTSSLTMSPLKPTIDIQLMKLKIEEINEVIIDFHDYMSKHIDIDKEDSDTFEPDLDSLITAFEEFKNNAEESDRNQLSPLNSPETSRHVETGTSECINSNSNDYNRYSSSSDLGDRVNGEHEFVQPDTRSKIDECTVNIDVPQVSSIFDSSRPENEQVSSDNFDTYIPSTNVNYLPFDRADDDDALSLFAESIESTRFSTASNFDAHDVYVPVTVRSWQKEKYTYNPTIIDETEPSQERARDPSPVRWKTTDIIIEKQNADSTSISKDTDINKQIFDVLQDAQKPPSLANASVDKHIKSRSFGQYTTMTIVKSTLYRGSCFFYNASSCRKSDCRFPHKKYEEFLLKTRLAVMSESSLIEEYLLTRNWIKLRRKFGVFFLEECKRRQATEICFEIAIDLGLGVVDQNNKLNIAALEMTLLLLNNIALESCSKFLQHRHNGVVMCDVLLWCIAESQNFAQFKLAFTKLAHYFCEIKRPVQIDVVKKILERVCILPCEDSLARGMLSLMMSTEPEIFEYTLTKSFEVQLNNLDSDVNETYLLAKTTATVALLRPLNKLPPPISDDSKDNPRHTSPDTTNLESLKKAQLATTTTTFKRTINTDIFKPPANPAPKRAYVPKGSYHWRRGGFEYSNGDRPTTGRISKPPVYVYRNKHRKDVDPPT